MATLIRSDLEFILQQIFISEAHAAGADLTTLVPNAFAPYGLRTVDGSYNNLVTGQSGYGAADQPFPTMVAPQLDAPYDGSVAPPPGFPPGTVIDGEPRLISNLIADMTAGNPAAAAAYANAGLGTLDPDGTLRDLEGNVIPPETLLTIPNTAPDVGLSAPFNSWFTFFGQFFDHGLDLVNKSSTELIVIPLAEDDPLYVPGSPTNFMVVSRTLKDEDGNAINQTTSFVDQNQTYTSHASHQVFLREYELDPSGRPVATGKMLEGANGGLATWADVKAQALEMLGIALDDLDVLNVPLLLTDQYGKFIPDPVTGFPQMVTASGVPPLLTGTPGAPIDASLGAKTGHAFLDDLAHAAKPVSTMGTPLAADSDTDTGNTPIATEYDNELLDRHFITGDGRGNENIALTAVHHVFHSEHNQQVDDIKATILATGDAEFIASWQLDDGSWNGERLFQAARFATEMQYQHLVFEEFARKLHPTIDAFLIPEGYDATINPAIVAEFAHAVYRLGHSMLTETVDRLDPNFNASNMGLLEAFLNPVAFDNDGALSADAAAGAIVRGMTRQVGNEIDEFVTDAVRNNLLGLPLDLAAINIARGRDTGLPTLNEARQEFYAATGDSQLKPYASWTDLALNLKHEASIVNFIAAYGTHASITTAATVAAKREAALNLVFGDPSLTGAAADAWDAERTAFLNGPAATTGVNDIDLWIGGLAERQMPFGGMLGSTFGFVFETQMEALQNGDRFYYLARLSGLNFLTEMENNSFAKLVMRHTDTTHLPADIFSTPGWILEVDTTRQHTGLGDGNDDPTEGGTALLPLVIRDDPSTPGADSNYLRYTGGDHVVLGGTDGNDTLIASIGDDTLWGDDGNDRMEGGAGNDNIEGGAGDDIITDDGGDDVLKGNAGNDVIHGGQGENLILGGDGKDFIITGEDVSETFAGQGDDFIYGAQMNLQTLGNEGNDWIEIGTSDGAGGDNFDPLGLGTIKGHDVFITGGGFDEAEGEGGDDIMVFSDGEDHFAGGGGFDWASYEADPFGVLADLFVNDFVEPPVPASNQGIKDRFAEVEGLSGSAFSDILRGDNEEAADINIPGALNGTLTDVNLYANLQAVLGAGVTSFNAGNILLGGDGSDLIEGRGGNDIIDGDKWLNVRISVRQNNDGTGPEIRSAETIAELIPDMVAGTYNPGQLEIVREIKFGSGAFNFDTAVFSGNRNEYSITTAADGTVTVAHNAPALGTLSDGVDTVRNVERLQFNDQAIVLRAGLNTGPTGQLAVDDTSPAVNQVLSVNALAVTDADNVSSSNPTGAITGVVSYFWQSEVAPGTGVFRDIVTAPTGAGQVASGDTFQVTPDLDGLAIRVRAVYKDANGVLENVYSAPTAAVGTTLATAPAAALPAEEIVTTPGIHFIRSDLQFILEQIQISEAHSGAYGTPSQDLRGLIDNTRLPFGVRTVDGSYNNLVPGQELFGTADENFPSLLDQVFRNDADGDNFFGMVTNTNYATTTSVADADPRIISNLIVDQTAGNFAAVIANGGNDAVMSPGLDGVFGTADDKPVFYIPNTAPDEGLSAQFNSWFTFFGQFFDHGLDLVDKGGNGTIFIPLEADDPLVAGADGVFGNEDDLAPEQRFLVLTRATNIAVQAGADGILNTADDRHFHNNETTSFVDQNQTYTSHASHQAFLREYAFVDGKTVATGRLLDSSSGAGLSNWAEVKANAATYLGITLTDFDIHDVPLIATDAYGKFIPDPVTGFAQVVTNTGLVSGVAGGLDLSTLNVARTGHAFLNDIAHHATPGLVDHDGNPGTPAIRQVADTDPGTADDHNPLTYDDELLNAHFITGDGRGNENIGLTAVHFIFHAEHNRLVDHIKAVALASNDVDFVNAWLLEPITELPTTPAEMEALVWNGERLFQAARFGTEMQYQHLVFEEFARKVQPQVDVFLQEGQGYDSTINPAIVAEFAHVVYRFGHSMLTETVDRYDADFNVVGGEQLGLIAAFLNPLEFVASGATGGEAAGAIVRGLTRQGGNEIDEFVTEALRNNLLGLPLDLATINIARGRDAGVPTLNQARAEFFAMTGDTQLKPYASWADLGANLKHEASLVNFIAAYGTHSTIVGADTNAERRAAAYALVYGEAGLDGIAGNADDATVAVPADRLAFLNGPAASTGVNAIDLWIGGLAEKQMPFGGLLGSTFNFVFETQMENLQNGDRFYYLERTANLNFLTELENNTFAKLIMANTDTKHLPGDVFSTPGFTLEVDETQQFTGLGVGGRDDPEGDVIRDNPATAGPDENYLQYTGDQHVVLGGTSGSDIIIASEGDDSLYGDEGGDRLEGGFGNDMIFGGAGDDIMTDIGGDDNLQGGDGNDAIHGGQGINLILGGFGNDFIVTGPDENESFGGHGNDFILGGRANEMVFGNEGDDWLEHGMVDGSAGENFDSRGLDAVVGNDVFIGDSVADRMEGEGGDDIMMGNGGQVDRYVGGSGFDWALFKHPTQGAVADLNLRAFNTAVALPNTLAATQARFATTEGLSGSAFGDILIGDNEDATTIPLAGNTGSVLTNFALINGLQEFVGVGVTSFSAGNIILGGDGSDLIEGRGGNDLIDGDMSLNVRISVRENADGTGAELFSVDTMTELVDDVFSGAVNPGQLVIVRELVAGDGNYNFDTAVFTGNRNEYTIDVDEVTGVFTVTHNLIDDDGTILVAGGGDDGTDRLTNIERMQFADQAVIPLLPGTNFNESPENALNSLLPPLDISDTTPAVGQELTVSAANLIDPDNIPTTGGAITGGISYFWQAELRPGSGRFEDIVITTPAGELRAGGTTFTPTAELEGLLLRVKGVYQDANGVMEVAYSAPTAAVGPVPVGAIPLSDMTPTEGSALLATNLITDLQGLTTSVFSFQWQQSGVGGVGAFTNIVGATSASFTPLGAQVDRALRVMVTYTDDLGNPETVFSAATAVTGDLIGVNAAGESVAGTNGQDNISAGAGSDTVNGANGDDLLQGGAQNDTVNGGAGDDTILYAVTDGVDSVDGGAGFDVLRITGNAGSNVLNVGYVLTALTTVAGGSVSHVESFRADLQGGVDTLSYAGTTDSVQVDLGAGVASGFTAVVSVENAIGGSGSDVLAGAVGVVNTLTGGFGNDVMVVHEATDLVLEFAGGGSDEVRSFANTYSILNTNVERLLFVGTGGFSGTGNALANTITGGGGTDVLTGNGGNDSLVGGGGNDVLSGGDENDALEGGAGNDSLVGGNGNDVLNGGIGNDTLVGGFGNDAINGGEGDDTVNYVLGTDGADAVNGGDGNDTLNLLGTAAANTLSVVYSGVALVNVAGGTLGGVETVALNLLGGADTLSYAGSTAAVVVDLTGTASGFASITSVENATGGSGNDTLVSAAGVTNVLTGGAGNDLFTVHDVSDQVVEAAGGGVDEVRSVGNTYTITNLNVERLTFIGSGNFSGTGNAGANLITGGIGNDTLAGLGGADTINAGDGDDTVNYTVGDGADVIDGGDGIDRINLLGNTGSNTLSVALSGGVLTGLGFSHVNVEVLALNLLGNTDTLSYAGSNDSVTVDLAGTASGFTSIASVENVVGGNAGDLLISAIGVNNVLSGGLGNDVFVVHESTDLVLEFAGGGMDEVQSFASTFSVQNTNVENLTYTGAGNFTGTGNALLNTIFGGAGTDLLNGLGGNDTLDGAGGNDVLNGGDDNDLLRGGEGEDSLNGGNGTDTLRGGTGNDVMAGGSGNDLFVFEPSFGQDTVTDFDAIALGGQDKLDISALGITAGTFGGSVGITIEDLDGDLAVDDTRVSIGGDSIALLNVNGVGANAIAQDDFILA